MGSVSKTSLWWVIIGGLLLYILYLQQCNDLGENNKTQEGLDTLSFKTDTVRITRVDTIRFSDTVIRYISLKIPKATPVPRPIESSKDSIKRDNVNQYTTEVNDSLLEGTIVSTVDGDLLDQSFSYTPKFPQYIIKRDSIFVKNELIGEKKKSFLFVGGELGGNLEKANISPIVGMYTKKGYSYSYRYGLLDKTHNVTISKRITFKFKK